MRLLSKVFVLSAFSSTAFFMVAPVHAESAESAQAECDAAWNASPARDTCTAQITGFETSYEGSFGSRQEGVGGNNYSNSDTRCNIKASCLKKDGKNRESNEATLFAKDLPKVHNCDGKLYWSCQ